MTHNQIMERINDDIPFEHQMMFIVKDYDRKVEENMELRKEVEELSAALAAQGAELKKAKKELKKMPFLKDKAMQLEAVRRKNEKLTRQVGVLFKCMVCSQPNSPSACHGRGPRLTRPGTAHERGIEEI